MIDVTRISSKGQVVIPKSIRDRLNLREGDKLIAFARDNLIILRRYEEESILGLLSQPIREKMARLAVKRKDVDDAVDWARKRP